MPSPKAVCGYRGLSLSAAGQTALVRFLGLPECFDPEPPPAMAIGRLAAAHLRRVLLHGAAAAAAGYLDRLCGDEEEHDDYWDVPTAPGLAAGRPGGSLHFR